MAVKDWIALARPFVFPYVILISLAGVAYAHWKGYSMTSEQWLNWGVIAFTCCWNMVIAHLFNAYHDWVVGQDRKKDGSVKKIYTSASHVIPEGRVKPERVYYATFLAIAIQTCVMVYLSYQVSLWCTPLILLALVVGLSYSIYLKPRGLAEVGWGIGVGVVLPLSGYIVATETIGWGVALAFTPIIILGAVVLPLDQHPDIKSDFHHKVTNVAMKLHGHGMSVSRYVEFGYMGVIMVQMSLVMSGLLPPASMAVLITLPLIPLTSLKLSRRNTYSTGMLIVMLWFFIYVTSLLLSLFLV